MVTNISLVIQPKEYEILHFPIFSIVTNIIYLEESWTRNRTEPPSNASNILKSSRFQLKPALSRSCPYQSMRSPCIPAKCQISSSKKLHYLRAHHFTYKTKHTLRYPINLEHHQCVPQSS